MDLSLNNQEKLSVSVFIPYRITKQGWESPDYEDGLTKKHLASSFESLSIDWIWQPVTFDNLEEVVRNISTLNKQRNVVVLNYCDGDEINGYPGISVVKLLESNKIVFTGADSNFYDITTSKIVMKQAFVAAGVSTAPYAVLSDFDRDIPGLCDRLGTPLIVKPAISAASYGISLKSVVHNDEQLRVQVERLLEGQHGWQFGTDGIFVEKFINGQEFTVLIIGTPDYPETIKIYPPTERAFDSSLPEEEKFLSYEKSWEIYEEEAPPPNGEHFYHYQIADSTLHKEICELSWHAYCAVGGTGYARVDLRMDKATQKLFVLEVNSNCGIAAAEDELSSVGNMLKLCGIPFEKLISEILTEAIIRHSTSSNKAI
jgi:D-alanine-D-alanine ligase